jgi:hypothetical protein
MMKDLNNSILSKRGGQEWMLWLGRASQAIPELYRAMQFLEESCALLESNREDDYKICLRRLKQLINRFIGQARCPSLQSCERIAIRTQILDGWLKAEQIRQSDGILLVELGSHGLQKLLILCEAADDKHGVLLRAVREFTRNWLDMVSNQIENQTDRAHFIYPISMLDQSGLVDPNWWWKQIALCDRSTVLGLIELDVNELNEMHPSCQVSWRSFDKRWKRLRLRGLLEFLGDQRLLAELLRKSAVDDSEAVLAVKILRTAGRSRDAILQAERWMRALPRSFILANTLFDLYVEDGWYEEALGLASTHYGYDSNPVWIHKLDCLDSPAAKEQIKDWKKKQPIPQQHSNSFKTN